MTKINIIKLNIQLFYFSTPAVVCFRVINGHLVPVLDVFESDSQIPNCIHHSLAIPERARKAFLPFVILLFWSIIFPDICLILDSWISLNCLKYFINIEYNFQIPM